jgi:hypothetical protein
MVVYPKMQVVVGMKYFFLNTQLSKNGGGVATFLEALPVNDRRTGLVIFLFGNPHLLEGG